jgi:tetratricopeptide (TPR) repeat protein
MRRLPGAITLLAAITVTGARTTRAQQPALARGLDLERQGSFAAAADAYRSVLAAHAADPAALLGLERALVPLNRSGELLAPARAAIAAGVSPAVGYAVLVRTWSAVGPGDSLRAAVEHWAALAPGDEAPYREWVGAAIGRGDRAAAQAAISLARRRLGRADALAPEAAQVAVAEGSWTTGAVEWIAAIRQMSGFRFAALAMLSPAPERARPDILRQLEQDGSGEGRRLAGTLVARWGDPVGGFRLVASSLPTENGEAVERLNQFLEALQLSPAAAATPARQARGMTLEAIAARTSGAAAARARMLAAQAYADAGDAEAARRMFDGAGAGREPAAPASAVGTAVSVLLGEGRADEAERRLQAARAGVPPEEYASLARRVAWGWARRGELSRAESMIAADSTVEGLAVAGRIALLRGDIRGATARLRAAGPYTGTREEASARASLLALLQRIEADSAPAIGAAFLALEKGDSTAAVAGFVGAAGKLPPDRGGAELRLLAGRLELARGRLPDAERLFRAADQEAAPATAPAAELELGRLLVSLGRRDEAVSTLEHMILTYSTSALVPQARRALDEARGAVPRT